MTPEEMFDIMREDIALLREARDRIDALAVENKMLRGVVSVQQTTIDILSERVEELGGYSD